MFFYIHIPFCRQKCLYCKFALTPKLDELKIRTYIDALKAEIEGFFAENPHVSIESIYFGGGTPSVLSGNQIGEILGIFRRQKGCIVQKSQFLNSLSSSEPAELNHPEKSEWGFGHDLGSFEIQGIQELHISRPENSIEITLEANPEDISTAYLEELSRLGINRLSLGVQTLNNEVLRMVGRADSNEVIFRAFESISQSPIENISIDLIAGLPGTLPGQVTSDLNAIFARISPKHVSIYMLEDESYPTSWKKHLPSEEMIQREYLSGMEWLQVQGFHRYELSNFATPGFESTHNRSYWNHSPYRGFGLSAASFVDGERFANSSSFTGYYRQERQTDGLLDTESLRIERMMFGFRTDGALLNDIRSIEALESFIEDGLLRRDENRVFLTSTGIFLIDHIIGELI